MDGEVLQSSCANSGLPGKPWSSLSVHSQPVLAKRYHREKLKKNHSLMRNAKSCWFGSKQSWWDFGECSGKEYHLIIQFILCWNRKQGLDCFHEQLQALSQVMAGWISWSPFSSWQHPQFRLNNKFCQSVHVFPLLCEILIANLF